MATTSDGRANVFFMFLGAGIFAYFGFGNSWAHQYTATNPPVFIPMVAVLMWTLRIGGIVFAISAVMSLAGMTLGVLLYSLGGVVTAILFVVVGIWQATNPQGFFSGMPTILLFLFAAWNGYGSWSALQEILASRSRSAASYNNAV